MNTIERERLRQQLTQVQLAKRAKVSRNVIVRAEAGDLIHKLKFAAICEALGLAMEAVTDIPLYDASEDRRQGRKKAM